MHNKMCFEYFVIFAAIIYNGALSAYKFPTPTQSFIIIINTNLIHLPKVQINGYKTKQEKD